MIDLPEQIWDLMQFSKKLSNVICNVQKARASTVSDIRDVSLYIFSAPTTVCSPSVLRSLHKTVASRLFPFTSCTLLRTFSTPAFIGWHIIESLVEIEMISSARELLNCFFKISTESLQYIVYWDPCFAEVIRLSGAIPRMLQFGPSFIVSRTFPMSLQL